MKPRLMLYTLLMGIIIGCLGTLVVVWRLS